eukprot:g11491.t1
MENTTNFVFGLISLLLGISIAALPLVPDHMFYLPCCGADLGQQSGDGLLLPPNSRNPVSGLLQCVACGNGYGPNGAGNDCIAATCPSGQKSFCGVCRTPFEEKTDAVSSVEIAFGLYVSICASVTILIWIVAFCSF